jgi:DNA-binding transcriptional LysR family regulator
MHSLSPTGVVRANLAISLMPQEVAQSYADTHGLCVLALDEPWAQRRFAICFRDEQGLSRAARLLLTHLQIQSAAGEAQAACDSPTMHGIDQTRP